MTHCKYCKKGIACTEDHDDEDFIGFCNKDCLSDYVSVQILQAKQDIAKLESGVPWENIRK